MVEGAALEMLYRGNSIVGSNPTLSAIFMPGFRDLSQLLPHFFPLLLHFRGRYARPEDQGVPFFECWFECLKEKRIMVVGAGSNSKPLEIPELEFEDVKPNRLFSVSLASARIGFG